MVNLDSDNRLSKTTQQVCSCLAVGWQYIGRWLAVGWQLVGSRFAVGCKKVCSRLAVGWESLLGAFSDPLGIICACKEQDY